MRAVSVLIAVFWAVSSVIASWEDTHPLQWGTDDVSEWLLAEGITSEAIVEQLNGADINGQMLSDLIETKWEDLEIKIKVKDRLRITKAFRSIIAEMENTSEDQEEQEQEEEEDNEETEVEEQIEEGEEEEEEESSEQEEEDVEKAKIIKTFNDCSRFVNSDATTGKEDLVEKCRNFMNKYSDIVEMSESSEDNEEESEKESEKEDIRSHKRSSKAEYYSKGGFEEDDDVTETSLTDETDDRTSSEHVMKRLQRSSEDQDTLSDSIDVDRDITKLRKTYHACMDFIDSPKSIKDLELLTQCSQFILKYKEMVDAE